MHSFIAGGDGDTREAAVLSLARMMVYFHMQFLQNNILVDPGQSNLSPSLPDPLLILLQTIKT